MSPATSGDPQSPPGLPTGPTAATRETVRPGTAARRAERTSSDAFLPGA